MTDQEKKEYNKEHYRKNRSVILDRMKTRYKTKKTGKIISIFGDARSGVHHSEGKENRLIRLFQVLFQENGLGTLFLLLLAVANTYFLVSEMARFYGAFDNTGMTSDLSKNRVPIEAYLKALLLEGSVLSLCLMIKAKTFVARTLHALLVLLIYSYSIWVVSGLAVQAAFSTKAQVLLFEKKVIELEVEISKKTALRDSYYQANRITLGSRIDHRIEELKQSLDRSRESLSKSPALPIIWNTLITVILFRILVMMSNLICLRELGRRYRFNLKIS